MAVLAEGFGGLAGPAGARTHRHVPVRAGSERQFAGMRISGVCLLLGLHSQEDDSESPFLIECKREWFWRLSTLDFKRLPNHA